ncbi:DUF5018 domain-containing protein [Marinoscillum sp. MHG1-6]|uniref:DUF5018 domain-containing protein n=1 Tax=Marinoscillum sp. MHG1-6 TaxID=2959627 RepID=UPI00215882B8|nr:DUF5018 domain-containing protein [Marinoscillum sp. MHG1-6]
MKKLFITIAAIAAVSLLHAQNVYIPDQNMKDALLADITVNTNSDTEISVAEAEAVTGRLNLNSKNIADATGLEAFINITELWIGQNSSLTTLDISANTKVHYLIAFYLPITSLDLTNNLLLDTVAIQNNNFTSLDLSKNTALSYLDVSGNNLSAIDVSNSAALKTFYFQDNNISSINYDPSLLSNLEGLGYGGNPLTATFDFTVFTNLKSLDASSSALTSIDVSSLSDLQTLIVDDNLYTSLDVTQNTLLTTLTAGNTSIVELDLSQNSQLRALLLSSNTTSKLESINLANGNNDNMVTLYLNGNPELSCIAVDNPDAINPFPNLTNYNLDGFTGFSDICVPGAISFADSVFENALLNHVPVIDTNDDGIITTFEAEAVTDTLHLSQKGIRNVQEIGYFSNVKVIELASNNLGNIDLKDNTSLTSIDVSYNSGLTVFSVDNGNNAAIASFKILGSLPKLTCVTVDDPTYSETNWTDVPVSLGFSTDCDVFLGDTNFLNALIADGYDLSADGKIQVSEAELVTNLDYSSKAIYSLYGLEAFVSLDVLKLPVTISTQTINLNHNTLLTELQICNKVSSLDLSMMGLLENFYLTSITSGLLNEIDFTANDKLKGISIKGVSTGTNINKVTVGKKNLLNGFTCQYTNVESLDLSQCGVLYAIDINHNNLLTSLNVRNGYNDYQYFSLKVQNNAILDCITVDDVAYAEANFSGTVIGPGFDHDCADAPIAFMDANFEAALLANVPKVDANDDGDIRYSEAAAFAGVLNLSGKSIAEAPELIYFTSTTGLDISNNNLTTLNIKNHNNENFTLFDARGNTGLTCINVDDVAYSEANWTNIDAGMSFSLYCYGTDIVYIPNTELKSTLVYNYDTNIDEEISYSEALAVTGAVFVSTSSVTDLTGLEAFENITKLTLDGVSVTSVPFAAWPDLTDLIIKQSYTQEAWTLNEVDLSQNLQLQWLQLSNLELSGLDVSMLSKLTFLECTVCGLNELDISNNSMLTDVRASYNNFSQISLPTSSVLDLLFLDYNQLDDIDLSGQTSLTRLSLAGNNFTTLDVSALTNLETIELGETNVVSLDLSNNNLLQRMDIYGTEPEQVGDPINYSALEELIMPNDGSNLWYIDLEYSRLKSIDLSNIPFDEGGGISIDLYGNDLRDINIGKVYALEIQDNPNLTCAQTTDPAYAEANYTFDVGLTFSEYCPSKLTDIVSFTVPNQEGETTIDKDVLTVDLKVTSQTSLTSITPTITLSEGATVSPVSGVAQDFSSAVTYTVTAEDGETAQDWIVNITNALNAQTDIVSFSFSEQTGVAIIDAVAHTVSVEVAEGTDLSALTPTITLSYGAGVSPNNGVAQDFSNPVIYTVTAEDEVTSQDWTVTVTIEQALSRADEWLNQYSVYPQPAGEVLNVHLGEGVTDVGYRIYDLSGTLVKSSYDQTEKGVVSIDLNELKAGIWLLQLSIDQELKTVRFIKY